MNSKVIRLIFPFLFSTLFNANNVSSFTKWSVDLIKQEKLSKLNRRNEFRHTNNKLKRLNTAHAAQESASSSQKNVDKEEGTQSFQKIKFMSTFPLLPSISSTVHTTFKISLLLGVINSFFKLFPYTAAFVTCGFKASLADIIVQKKITNFSSSIRSKNKNTNDESVRVETESQSINYKRVMAFLLYGGLYQGCAQEYIFNHLYPAWFGTSTAPIVAVRKVLFDMLVVSPFLCLPVAYISKSFIFRYSIKEAMLKYAHDTMKNGLLVKYWMLWFPVNLLTFTVIPEHLRIAWIAAISFFWMIILSYVSSKSDDLELSKKTCASLNATDLENGAYKYDDDIMEKTETSLLLEGVSCGG